MGLAAYSPPGRRNDRTGFCRLCRLLAPVLAAILGLGLAAWPRQAAAEVLYVQTRAVNVRAEPENTARIIALRYRGDAVEVTTREEGWCRVKLEENREGWIYQSALGDEPPEVEPSSSGGGARGAEDSNTETSAGSDRAKAGAASGEKEFPIRYEYINSQVREYFNDEIDWLGRELAGEELNPKALHVSYREGARTARLMLILPFDVEFYHESKGLLLRENSIDLLPFRVYLWSLQEYLERVAARADEDNPEIADEIRKFQVSLVLQKEEGEEVVLSGSRRHSFVQFSPYIMVKRRGYEAALIKTVSEEALEKATVFFLPEPKLNSGSLAEAVLLYDFFEVNY